MNTNRQNTSKLTILYERLSVEDEHRSGDSNSIAHQKSMLEDYAKRQGFGNIIHITDDGHSGTRFDRPGFNKMMDEVATGNVGIVIVKDLSRFGRDHLRVGLYTESLRECGVRFIAVQDNVDTANGEDDFTPFRNIINEWAARDSSRKVKAVMRNKGMSGKRLTTAPIYGYNYHPQDKTQWVVDSEAAEIVRRIFRMTIAGVGPHEIARALNNDKIERPSVYLNQRGIVPYKHKSDNPYAWNSGTVGSIISKLEYIGSTVNFRYRKDSYKDRYSKLAPKEEWAIFNDTHEGIIDSDTWETAQKCRKTIKRTDSLGEANPLTGKMFCADCGARMYNHRKPYSTPHYTNPNTGKTYMRSPSDVYSCATHDNAKAKFVKSCTLHHISTKAVRELLLDTIRRVSVYVRENEEEFVQRLREASAIQQDKAAKAHKKQIAKNTRRIDDLDLLFRKTYEDNATGKLSDERFQQLSDGYEVEQRELKQRNAELQAEVDGYEADSVKAENFIILVKRYTDFPELNASIINEFVDRIVVHEADRSSGKRIQRVDIYFNFIGAFDIPVEESIPTAEELEAERKQDALRAKRRQYNRRHIAKVNRRVENGVLLKDAPSLEQQKISNSTTA